MAFGQPNYSFLGNPGFQAGIYPQPMQPAFPQRQETPSIMPQPGMLSARYVTGREEAVAAQIFPGDPFIFADFANGRMYVKQINPQTMAADFVEFARVPPAQPQATPQQPAQEFASAAELRALQAQFEALADDIESMRTAFAQPKPSRKAVASNDE